MISSIHSALLLETSNLSGSICVVHGNKQKLIELPPDRGSAQTIATAIDQALRECQVTPQDLDAIAVTNGPGSFTGLRVGLGLGRAMAFALEKPLIGISTLEVVANTFKHSHDHYLITALNAYRQELFVAAWKVSQRNNGFSVKRFCPDQRIDLNKLPEFASDIFGQAAVESQSFKIITPEPSGFFANAGLSPQTDIVTIKPSAAAIWQIIQARLPLEPQPVDEVLPIYLRGSAAEEKSRALSATSGSMS